MKTEILWEDDGSGRIERDRPLSINRVCPCGTCQDSKNGVGYISGSIDGEGVTVWIQSEKVYQRLEKLFAQL